MEPSGSNTLEEIPHKQAILIDQDKNKIASVLDTALKQKYTKASAEWITSPPDLSQPPFNLATKGICGNPALLEFGDVSYFRKPYVEIKEYSFKHILKLIGRDKCNSFIFGHGVFKNKLKFQLNEIVLNASFPPVTNRELQSRNNSGLIIIDSAKRRCKKEKLDNLDLLKCSIQGTYFLSEGLIQTENESVLKVYAKGPYFDKTPFCGSNRFINSMQEALKETFGYENFVALGGVYAVSNVKLKHKCIRNDWESPATIPHNCQRDPFQTEIMITTFNSGTGSHPIIPTNPPIKLYSPQSIHSLLHHSALEKYPLIDECNKEEEYIGYFCPAKSVHRFDETNPS